MVKFFFLNTLNVKLINNPWEISLSSVLTIITIFISIGTLIFAIVSNKKSNEKSEEREKTLDIQQAELKETQDKIANNLNESSKTQEKISSVLEEIEKDQELLAVQVKFDLEIKYSDFFTVLKEQRIYLEKIFNEYQKYNNLLKNKNTTAENTSQFRNDLENFWCKCSLLFAKYDPQEKVTKEFPAFLTDSFIQLHKKYTRAAQQINKILRSEKKEGPKKGNIDDCVRIVLNYKESFEKFIKPIM